MDSLPHLHLTWYVCFANSIVKAALITFAVVDEFFARLVVIALRNEQITHADDVIRKKIPFFIVIASFVVAFGDCFRGNISSPRLIASAVDLEALGAAVLKYLCQMAFQ